MWFVTTVENLVTSVLFVRNQRKCVHMESDVCMLEDGTGMAFQWMKWKYGIT